MSNYELRRHKAADTIKWIVVFVLLLATIGAVISLFFMLDRQTTTTEIGPEQYMIGGLDDEGAAADVDTSIVTRNAFTVNGLDVEVADEATVTYELFFYDGEGKFISSTGEQTADFGGSVPEAAETAKIVITPTADEDGKVSLTEVIGYASMVTVTIDR